MPSDFCSGGDQGDGAMNAKRLTTAFIVALVVSALCTWLLSRKIGTQAARRDPDHHYVASVKPLQAGEVLKLDSLETVSWPAGNPITGAYVKPEDLNGRTVLYPLDKDQPITDRFLSAPGAGLGITGKIPDGMRAISLRSDEVMGVAGFIYPGSHLDVLVTYHPDGAPEPITFTVLQDAEVLAVGQKSQPDPEGKPSTATVVTLLLTPQDAERAVLASTQGAFHFVLRSGSDKAHVENLPISLAGMSGRASAPRASAGRRVAQAHEAPEKKFTVETVSGDKSTRDSFSGGR
jgi:pilus assembly protein CpaB